jgi:TM2 domain-containing membrane protein YozV
MNNAGVASILSLVVPGVGQIYNGDILRGAFWLIATPGGWVASGGIVGGACHLVSAYTAYHRAKVKEQADSCRNEASGESVTVECISPCPAR